MIARRGVLLAGGFGLLAAHRLGGGQPAPTLRRVGYLGGSSLAAGGHLLEAFKQGMRDLGWREGINVEFAIAHAGNDMSRNDALARELLSRQVEVVVASNTQATQAAQRATTTVPIVMTNASNAVGNGFVASLSKPGGNVTGISSQAEEVLGKLIQQLHEVVPAARRIAVLLNETHPSHAVFWSSAQAACAALGLAAVRVVASTPAQVESAADDIVRSRSQAVVAVADPMFFGERVRLQAVMRTTGLPVAYGLREHVSAGGLLSYAADLPANWRHSARWVDKILKGARASDLPVEQPTRFGLVINAKAAKALGITIPRAVLMRADEVIE